MNTDFSELLRVMRRELWIKRRLFAGVYLATALLFLVVGWNWPKFYTSSSTIMVDQQSILEPLMEGTAVTTDVMDRAEVAREIIFSRRAMEEVMRNSGWINENTSDLQRERVTSVVEGRTRVESAGENIIRISFEHSDPEVAYNTARNLTEVFINHSLMDKQRESREAYEFINSQVIDYHTKLKQAEEALKQFRSENIDSRPGSGEEVSDRVNRLQERLEAAQLAIRELQIERETLERQLSGEAVTTAGVTRTGQLRERLANLEQELATLRLSYHDTYPDIVRLKGQIASVRDAIAQEQSGSGSGGAVAGTPTSSELFRELRRRYSETETQLAALQERQSEVGRLLEKEQQRRRNMTEGEAQLAELTRDYEVNQDLYQSLLRQRENARISMNIDREDQGLTFQIQEPAAVPLTPQGIRFAHFAAAGLLLSFALPLGLIYGLTMLDQRVRSRNVITESLGLPVLASVYQVNRPIGYDFNTFKKSVILLVIVVSWIAYGIAAYLRING